MSLFIQATHHGLPSQVFSNRITAVNVLMLLEAPLFSSSAHLQVRVTTLFSGSKVHRPGGAHDGRRSVIVASAVVLDIATLESPRFDS